MAALEGRKTVTVDIGGDSYVLIPNFDAVVAIEGALGKTVFEITQDCFKQGIGVTSAVLFHAIRANSDNNSNMLTINQVGQAVTQDFATSERALMRAVLEFLNEYYPKNEEPAEKKPEGQ